MKRKEKVKTLEDYVGRSVCIKWADAVTYHSSSISEIKDTKSILDMLVPSATYGKLVKADEYGVVVLHHMTRTEEAEYTVIPLDWVTKWRIYR